MREKFKSETELAKVIIQYLKEMGWEIYQEVQISSYGNIADIVAVQNKLVWILECKLSLSMSLLAQAHDWLSIAHYVSIVVPTKRRNNKTYNIVKEILNHFGIGCYKVGYNQISEFTSPRLNRKALSKYITRHLCDEQKNWSSAGNSKGKRYTPFQNTKFQLIKAVTANPGITMKEIVKLIDHHYSSDKTAKSSLLHWIHMDIIKGIRLEIGKGREYKFYLKNEK